MARSESGPDWYEGRMSDAELEAFQDAVGDLGDRVSEFLVEDSELTVEEFENDVDEYPIPDALEDHPVDGQQDE